MRYAAVTFTGWVVSFITEANTILQALVLLVSLLIGLIGLFKQLRKKKP